MDGEIIFWILIALMSALGVLILLHGLSREDKDVRSRSDFDLSVYKDQLEGIERDVARGALDEGEAAASRTEVERRILESARQTRIFKQGPAEGGAEGGFLSAKKKTALVLIILVPLFSLGIYLFQGAPGLINPSSPSAAGGQEGITPAQIEAMVENLAARLAEDPSDPKGWRMLGRSYAVLGRRDEAEKTLEKASELFPGDADLLGEYARLLINEGEEGLNVPPRAAAIFKRILKLRPDDGEALWFLGYGALAQGEKEEALSFWRRLLSQIPPEVEHHATLKRMIEEVENNGADKQEGSEP